MISFPETKRPTLNYAKGITELIMIRDFIRTYKKRELEILQELRLLDDGVYTDDCTCAMILTIVRDHVDIEAMRSAYPAIVKEFTSKLDVKVVRTSAT